MAQFHFIEDYEKHVADLIEKYPIDEAMSLAVGGLYQEVGLIEIGALRYAGLKDGMSLIDLGCGSGRLASVLGRSLNIEYTGIDVVQSLLDYAKTKSPGSYRFLLHRALSVPAADNSSDFLCAFSVFTHLLHAETYIYLKDIRRTLKPGGKLVFSFLEFASDLHWHVFEATVDAHRLHPNPLLNTFIERPVIDIWCGKLGYELEGYISGNEAPWNGKPLGQSVVLLRKPDHRSLKS
jgi:ubiquinone/menaquinone biosynthesis C-methylase UbiE